MKEISNTIFSFIKSNYSKKIQHKYFSSKGNRFIGKLFLLLSEGESLYKNARIEKKSIVINQHNADNYIPEDIKKIIYKQKYATDISFSIEGRKYTIHMYHSYIESTSIINQHVKRIFMWLYLASRFSHSKCSQNMTIKIYFTNAKKILPNKQRLPIEQEHANTAFTTSCKKETEINIFREEEWFKVCIHETFHCMGLDFSEMNNSASDAMILKIFPLNADVRLYETYCEIWAETMNIMFISYLSSRNKNVEKMIEKTEKFLYYERLFSLFQCVKVIRHFHLTYDDIINKTKRANENYKEKTQILSYYILKCIYMFYINEYVDWCIDNNGETLDFNKKNGSFEKTVQSYVVFLETRYKLPEFLESIKYFENNSVRKNIVIENTLRMSLFEI
jgi:hypothetical protein